MSYPTEDNEWSFGAKLTLIVLFVPLLMFGLIARCLDKFEEGGE